MKKAEAACATAVQGLMTLGLDVPLRLQQIADEVIE
jgi:hypothetical protein